MNGNYAGNFLNLKDHVYFFILTDPDTKKGLGKIINPGGNRHYNATNSTAAHLLYLLARPKPTEIHFDQLQALVVQKYGRPPDDAASKLNTFLDKLNAVGILDNKTNGQRTDEPDPCELFNTEAMWDENPDIVPAIEPKTRGYHVYGCGNAASSIWR
jgi:hypothetical protein